MDPKEIHEKFLEANANPAFISGQVEEVARELLRAIAAVSDAQGPVNRAADKMVFVLELFGKCRQPPPWHFIFHCAVEALRAEKETDESLERAIYDAAKAGIAFIAEVTSGGGAPSARISKRRNIFLSEVEGISRLRDELGRRR